MRARLTAPRALALAVLVMLALSPACGGGGDDDVAESTTTTETSDSTDRSSDSSVTTSPEGTDADGGDIEPETVTYCSPDDVDLSADLYRPHGDGPHPVVLYAHGGGWTSGSRTTGAYLRELVPHLVARGVAVMSIDYRLAPEVTIAGQLDDVACAVDFVQERGEELGLDPDRLAAAGASSGGHLVSLLATSDREESDHLRAVVDLFGPADLDKLRDFGRRTDRVVSKALGIATSEPTDLGRRHSPAQLASPGDPPFLIVHGDADDTVPLSQSEAFRDALAAADVPVELVVVEGGPHGLDDAEQSPTPGEVAQLVVDYLVAAVTD